MSTTAPGFEFEQPILDLETQLKALEKNDSRSEAEKEQISRA